MKIYDCIILYHVFRSSYFVMTCQVYAFKALQTVMLLSSGQFRWQRPTCERDSVTSSDPLVCFLLDPDLTDLTPNEVLQAWEVQAAFYDPNLEVFWLWMDLEFPVSYKALRGRLGLKQTQTLGSNQWNLWDPTKHVKKAAMSQNQTPIARASKSGTCHCAQTIPSKSSAAFSVSGSCVSKHLTQRQQRCCFPKRPFVDPKFWI